jgi:hypothetical protein
MTPWACDDAARPSVELAKQAEAKAAETKAAETKASEEEAKRRAEERKKAEQALEQAYVEARAKLEPLAKLPKNRPKGFAKACEELLPAYVAYMGKSLQSDAEALARWNDNEESRIEVLRRECHKRSVEVVACQTHLLHNAPQGTDIDHIMRVCAEKY